MPKNKTIPPSIAKRILLFFLRDDLGEEVEGDLEEKFLITSKNKSLLRAQLNYWYQVMNYLRPFAVRKTKTIYLNDYAMFQNYFKIGWRNMRRNMGYTSINVGGLAVGMAVAILNGLWIWDELSFNKHYDNYDRIAQLAIRGQDKEGQWIGLTLTYPMATELIEHHSSHFKHIVRFGWGGGILSLGEKIISVEGASVDTGAPDMFTLKMKYGSRDGLQEAHSIMIAASVLIPSAPFEYKFVDEEYTRKFAAEERIGKLASFFGTLAIFISCLGLFGLASFVAEQRTKEIGIRKVLGASVINLWRMLSRDFVVLVILSCIIAVPIAYYFLDGWLQKYQYRIEISWWVFVIAGLGSVTITLATVSFQAVRAALMNPVNSLRSE